MPYRLTPTRPIDKDLSRIVDRQFENALEALQRRSRDGSGIHDARTAIKKIRAVLHLLRSPLGKTYRRANKQLRAVAHELSSSRDASALLEVLSALHRHYRHKVNAAMLRGARKGLTSRARAATARLHPAALQRRLAEVARVLPRRVRHVAGRGVVRDGVVQGYSRARHALRDVQATPEDGCFHAWRRRVKDHWYHVRLLERVHPAVKSRIAQLKRLEVLLGDDHNLVVLRATLLAKPSRFGSEDVTTAILGCIDKYQARLRKEALALGKRLFSSSPRSFETSLKARNARGR